MNPARLALVELPALALGALAARGLVRRVGRGERKVVIMASISAWLVLFGMVPFFVFAGLLPHGPHGTGAGGGRAGPLETLILNAVPFAMVISPALGLVQALLLTGPRQVGWQGSRPRPGRRP